MAESTTLPQTFAASLKQTFRAFTVDMVPTNDGRHAIRLAAHDGPALVIGWVDLVSESAELCTLGHALSLSKAQIGRELRLPPVEYLRFLERASILLEESRLKVTVVTHASKSNPPPRMERRGSPTPYYGIIAASASLIGAVAWLIAH